MTEKTIYVIGSHGQGPVKIGCSANPSGRLKALQGANSETLAILATHPGGHDIERMLHQFMSAHRVHGEWFRRTDEVAVLIRNMAGEISRMIDEKRIADQSAESIAKRARLEERERIRRARVCARGGDPDEHGCPELEEILHRSRMTATELAHLAGMNDTVIISRWRTGRGRPHALTRLFARALLALMDDQDLIDALRQGAAPPPLDPENDQQEEAP